MSILSKAQSPPHPKKEKKKKKRKMKKRARHSQRLEWSFRRKEVEPVAVF